jgi:hypothetical protein
MPAIKVVVVQIRIVQSFAGNERVSHAYSVVVAQMIIYRNGFGKVLGLGGAGSSWET